MTHLCCPDCRLRFTPTAVAYLDACPQCGAPPEAMVDLEAAVGFRLFTLEDVPHPLPEAAAASLPLPDPNGGRS